MIIFSVPNQKTTLLRYLNIIVGDIQLPQLFLTIFFSIFIFLSGAAQLNPTTSYVVSGYIIEEGSLEQLLGVTVYDPNFKTGTISNGYGFYSLKLEAGEHTLIVSHLGHVQKELQINVDGDIERNTGSKTDFTG